MRLSAMSSSVVTAVAATPPPTPTPPVDGPGLMPSGSPTVGDGSSTGTGGVPIGGIVGGVVGLAVVIAVAVLAVVLLKRRRASETARQVAHQRPQGSTANKLSNPISSGKQSFVESRNERLARMSNPLAYTGAIAESQGRGAVLPAILPDAMVQFPGPPRTRTLSFGQPGSVEMTNPFQLDDAGDMGAAVAPDAPPRPYPVPFRVSEVARVVDGSAAAPAMVDVSVVGYDSTRTGSVTI